MTRERATLFPRLEWTEVLKRGVGIAFLGVIWVVSGGGLTASSGEEDRGANPYAGNPQVIAEGKRLYLLNGCYACHGIDATGRIGPDLTKSPRTDQEMFDRIHDGKEGTAMGPFKDKITPDEIWKIITYLRSLAKP